MAVCSMYKPEFFWTIGQEDFSSINSKKDLSEKLIAMTHILQLTDEDILERQGIQSEITRFLKPYYPNCWIAPFGSSVNGFGFRGSDLDLLFLPFPEYCNIDFKDRENVTIPVPYHVLEEKYPKDKLLSMNDKCHLRFVQRIMYTKRYFFRKVTFIPAKCPILNIKFVTSEITCDFSASNRLVLANTDLQWLYGKLDCRVKPLLMVLRYWAKSLGFIKKTLLSSYAFSLLVIFYLQNTQPSILPSVKSLIELSGYSYKVDGWETGICKNLSLIPRSENNASIEQLLMGFFDFYWNFDFIHNIVSPHTAKAMPIKELLESNDERIKTFQVTPFSIQDAFVLSRNISRNSAMMTSFKLALLIAQRLLQKGDLFQNLFDICIYQAEMDKMFKPVLQNFHSCSVSCALYLSYEICCKFGLKDGLDSWYEKVCQTVFDVLQYGLLMECEVIDKVIGNKEATERPRKKRKHSNNNPDNLILMMSIQCAVYYNTWQSRKKSKGTEMEPVVVEDGKFSGALQREHDLSLKMSLNNEKNKQTPLLWFLCNCYTYSSAQITDVVLIFAPLENVAGFTTMSDFLKSFVRKMLLKVLSEEKSANSLSP